MGVPARIDMRSSERMHIRARCAIVVAADVLLTSAAVKHVMPSLNPFDSVVSALKKEQIIPDVRPNTPPTLALLIYWLCVQVIPADFVPTTLLNVSWGDKEAQLGNELTKADTTEVPVITFAPGAEDHQDSTYTLAFLDPDAPSRADPKFGPFRHWVVSNKFLGSFAFGMV